MSSNNNTEFTGNTKEQYSFPMKTQISLEKQGPPRPVPHGESFERLVSVPRAQLDLHLPQLLLDLRLSTAAPSSGLELQFLPFAFSPPGKERSPVVIDSFYSQKGRIS